MALATTLTVTIRDTKGKESPTKIRIPTGFSIPQMVEFAEDAVQLIANATQGEVMGATLSIAVELPGGLKAAAELFADVWNKAQFIVTSTVSGLFARLQIPGISDGKVLPNSDLLDPVDADVAAYETFIESGVDDGFGTGIQPVDLRDNALDVVTQRREIFRKS